MIIKGDLGVYDPYWGREGRKGQRAYLGRGGGGGEIGGRSGGVDTRWREKERLLLVDICPQVAMPREVTSLRWDRALPCLACCCLNPGSSSTQTKLQTTMAAASKIRKHKGMSFNPRSSLLLSSLLSLTKTLHFATHSSCMPKQPESRVARLILWPSLQRSSRTQVSNASSRRMTEAEYLYSRFPLNWYPLLRGSYRVASRRVASLAISLA